MRPGSSRVRKKCNLASIGFVNYVNYIDYVNYISYVNRGALCEISCRVRQFSSTNLVVTRWSGELRVVLDEACGVWTAG